MTTTPLTILIAALGGEGGSVLMNWIVAAARQAGFAVQATSVPGVAQRTGSTSYYIEMLPAPDAGSPQPVFALVPMPGRVDIVVASEIVEAGRVLERGFVSPTRTTLITSTSRVITTAEKVHGGDGRFAPERVTAGIAALAKRHIALDLDGIARANGTLVSAAMYGALAASGALPWDAAHSARVITETRSRAGFDAAVTAVRVMDMPPDPLPDVAVASTATSDPLEDMCRQARTRLIDYQDTAYADLFEARLQRLLAAAPSTDTQARQAIVEAARRLALWMAYEDVPRVADLKSRPERFARIRAEAEAQPDHVVTVIDYLKPGAEEIAAMLPQRLGARLMRRVAAGKSIPLAGRPLHLKATSITGFATLRALAQFKRWRRGSLRYAEEQAGIEAWLKAMEQGLARAPAFALALAELPRVLKGYSDTHVRGRANYSMLFEGLVRPALADGTEAATAQPLRRAIATAIAEPANAGRA